MVDPSQIPNESVIHFPDGVPGLDDARRFVVLKPDNLEPVIVLQSLECEHVSLPAAPVRAVCEDYQLELNEEDRAALGVDDQWDPSSLLCLAVITPGTLKAPPVCNLFAPIVVNPEKMLGRQVLQIGADYPTIHPLKG